MLVSGVTTISMTDGIYTKLFMTNHLGLKKGVQFCNAVHIKKTVSRNEKKD